MSIYFESLNNAQFVEKTTSNKTDFAFYNDGVYVTSEFGDKIFLTLNEVEETLHFFKEYLGVE